MDITVVASNIKRICKEQGYNIAYLEKTLGMSVGLISRWSSGKSVPSFDKICDIADFLNTGVDTLIGNTVNSQKTQEQSLALRDFEKSRNEIDQKTSITDYLIKQDWSAYDMYSNVLPDLSKIISSINYSDVQAFFTTVEMRKYEYNDMGFISREIRVYVDYYLLNYYKNSQPVYLLYVNQQHNHPVKLQLSSSSLKKIYEHVNFQEGERISEINMLSLFEQNNIVIA